MDAVFCVFVAMMFGALHGGYCGGWGEENVIESAWVSMRVQGICVN